MSDQIQLPKPDGYVDPYRLKVFAANLPRDNERGRIWSKRQNPNQVAMYSTDSVLAILAASGQGCTPTPAPVFTVAPNTPEARALADSSQVAREGREIQRMARKLYKLRDFILNFDQIMRDCGEWPDSNIDRSRLVELSKAVRHSDCFPDKHEFEGFIASIVGSRVAANRDKARLDFMDAQLASNPAYSGYYWRQTPGHEDDAGLVQRVIGKPVREVLDEAGALNSLLHNHQKDVAKEVAKKGYKVNTQLHKGAGK